MYADFKFYFTLRSEITSGYTRDWKPLSLLQSKYSAFLTLSEVYHCKRGTAGSPVKTSYYQATTKLLPSIFVRKYLQLYTALSLSSSLKFYFTITMKIIIH